MDNNFSKILDIFKRLDEGVMSEIDLELREIVATEDFDALYNLLSANTPTGRYVQDMYQDITIDSGLHPDDDFEAIEEILFDRLADEFGAVDEGTPISTTPDSIDPGGATDNFKQQMANNTELKYQGKLKQIQGGGVAENSKFNFAGEKRGQKPGDQWRGTDAGTPGNKLVGAAESIEQECDTNKPMSPIEAKLRAMWNKHKQGLAELGANNPGQNNMGGGAPASGQATAVDQAQQAKDLQQTQQNLNKLKSAGVAIPTSISQASQTAIKATNTPTAIPNQTDKKVSMGLGQEIEKLLTTGNQNQIGQVANVLKQVKQGQGQ
jgi:hypothetical protein